MNITTDNSSSSYRDWINETQNQQDLHNPKKELVRVYTKEERLKIASTVITEECFDFIDFENVNIPVVNPDTLQLDGTKFIRLKNYWERLIQLCDMLRFLWCVTQDEKYFNELIRILPKSYKVVDIG